MANISKQLEALSRLWKLVLEALKRYVEENK